MSETTTTGTPAVSAELDPETEELAQQVADQVESFLLAVREISQYEVSSGQAISLLLLVVSQVLAAHPTSTRSFRERPRSDTGAATVRAGR